MKQKIETIIRNITGEKAAFDVFVPEQKGFGQYSTNVAMRAGGKNPLAFAHKLIPKIREAAPSGFFEKVEAAPPGFINFWITPLALTGELARILKDGTRYGTSKIGRGKKVQLEFVSANPTGPLTLANGRGGFLGDVLARVLAHSGWQVEREYYVNDTGNQVLTLGKSILAFAGDIAPEDRFYKGEYLKTWLAKHRALTKKYRANPMALGETAAKDFLRETKSTLRKAGIRFDRFTSEKKDIHAKALTKKVLAIFERKKLVYEKDGAVWLKTTEFGDDKDRVLVTRDGFPTYFLADAGHYLETKERGFDEKINIVGPDHHGYVRRIQAVAEIVGLKNSKIIVTQAIRLVRDGEEVKMSKRAGKFIEFKELMKEVGADAARFFFLHVAPETHINFDLKLAKERSPKNPVYYIQYAYVRAESILRKIKKPSFAEASSFDKSSADRSAGRQKSKIKITKLSTLLNTLADVRLMAELARFPDVIRDAAEKREAHPLTRYASELAEAFHNFYEKERVIGEEKDIVAARAALTSGAAIVLKNLLDILGIRAPKKM